MEDALRLGHAALRSNRSIDRLAFWPEVGTRRHLWLVERLLITCPQYAILAGFLSDRVITWGKAAASCRHFAKTERAYLGNLANCPWRNPNAAFIGQSGNHLAMWQTGYPTQT